jgi:cytochrome c biogenesis protein CcmG, thiol:disulfide interchange protein DsbE
MVVSLVVGIVVVGLVAVLALSDGGDDAEASSALIGQAAPPVTGTTLDGETFDMDELRGRYVLVNFFADWCPPCVEEHPELVAFDEDHEDAGDVEVVSVAFQNDRDDVQAFFDANGGEWPVLVDDIEGVAVGWGVTALPETFLVSPRGIVLHKFTGGVTQDQVESILAQAQGSA